MSSRNSIRDFTGATIIRAEFTDGRTINVNEDEVGRRIEWGDVKLRAMPGNITGDDVERFLYSVLGLDQHRFVFDLPSSMRGTGATRTGVGGHAGGRREGFVHRRGSNGRADGDPICRLFFITSDRRFAEVDPQDRRDFEALR